MAHQNHFLWFSESDSLDFCSFLHSNFKTPLQIKAFSSKNGTECPTDGTLKLPEKSNPQYRSSTEFFIFFHQSVVHTAVVRLSQTDPRPGRGADDRPLYASCLRLTSGHLWI